MNERYLFSDLDEDGTDEMIAYKEIWREDEYAPTPYLSIFDIADRNEISLQVEIDISYYYYARIYLSALNRIIIEDNMMEGYYSYSILTYGLLVCGSYSTRIMTPIAAIRQSLTN